MDLSDPFPPLLRAYPMPRFLPDVCTAPYPRVYVVRVLEGHSPQRLCVTLTRARYHLLIVGDKKVLLTSPLWREIVKDSQVVASVDTLRASSVPR